MKRLDTEVEELFWKACIAGASGTGKTTLAVTAPKPLILLSERQGLPSIKVAAKRLGKEAPPVLYVETPDDYRMALRALSAKREGDFVVRSKEGEEVLRLKYWPETVVLDSLTDAIGLFIKEIRLQSPQKVGRDGLPVDAQRFWGVLADRSSLMIKAFRDLPMHVLFLCLRDERTKEDEDGNIIERIVQPRLTPRSLVGDVTAAVNLVGYTYKTFDKKKQTAFGVVFDVGEGAITKNMQPLRKVEVPDVASWIARLSGFITDAPQAPVPPIELIEPPAPEAPPVEPKAEPKDEPAGAEPEPGAEPGSGVEPEAEPKPQPEPTSTGKPASASRRGRARASDAEGAAS